MLMKIRQVLPRRFFCISSTQFPKKIAYQTKDRSLFSSFPQSLITATIIKRHSSFTHGTKHNGYRSKTEGATFRAKILYESHHRKPGSIKPRIMHGISEPGQRSIRPRTGNRPDISSSHRNGSIKPRVIAHHVSRRRHKQGSSTPRIRRRGPLRNLGSRKLTRASKRRSSQHKVNVRTYSATRVEQTPLNFYFAEFLGGNFQRQARLIFKEESIDQYFQHIRHNKEFTAEEITMIINDFHKAAILLNQTRKALAFCREVWIEAFANKSDSQSVLLLKQKLIGQREILNRSLIENGRADLYRKYIQPMLKDSDFAITPLESDYILEISHVKRSCSKANELYSKGRLRLVLERDIPIELKRRLLKSIIIPTLRQSIHKQVHIQAIKDFMRYAKIIEQKEWYDFADFHEYDEILELIAIRPWRSNFIQYAKSLVVIVQRTYWNKAAGYIFLTRIMRSIVDKHPHLALRYFRFKEVEVKYRGVPREMVLFKPDLTCAMKACIALDTDHLYRLYTDHPELQDKEQDEIILRFLLIKKQWELLQKKFEELYQRRRHPDIEHYAVTMEGLELLHAEREIRRLFNEITGKQLKLNGKVFSMWLRSYVRSDQLERVTDLIEQYLSLCRDDKAEPDGIKDIVKVMLEIPMSQGDPTELVTTIGKYLQKEVDEKLPMVSEDALVYSIKFMATNFAIKELEDLRELISQYKKFLTTVYENLIVAYTHFGQFERADEICFEAHAASPIPFTEGSIYYVQYRNMKKYLAQAPDQMSFLECWRRIKYPLHIIRKSKIYLLFNRDPRLAAENIRLTFESDLREPYVKLKHLQHRHMRHSSCYEPFIEYHYERKNYQNTISRYLSLLASKLQPSSRAYLMVLEAILNVDKELGDGLFKNSRSFFLHILNAYGIVKSHTKSHRVDFKDDAEDIAKCIGLYCSFNGKKALPFVLRFIEKCKEEFGIIPFPVRNVIYEAFQNMSMASEQSTPHPSLGIVHAKHQPLIEESPSHGTNEKLLEESTSSEKSHEVSIAHEAKDKSNEIITSNSENHSQGNDQVPDVTDSSHASSGATQVQHVKRFNIVDVMRRVSSANQLKIVNPTMANLELHIQMEVPELGRNRFEDIFDVYSKFIADYPYKEEEIIIPPALKQAVTSAMLSRLSELKNGFDSDGSHKVAQMLIKMMNNDNITFEQRDLPKIFQFLLGFPNDRYLEKVLDICENQLVYNNWKYFAAMKEKRLCYMCFLSEVLHAYPDVTDETIDKYYRIFSEFYGVNAAMVKKSPIYNERTLLRGRTGRLFSVASDHYKHRSMTMPQFVEYFNPERIPKFVHITNNMRNLLIEKVGQFCQGDEHKAFELMDKYPSTIQYLNSINLQWQEFLDIPPIIRKSTVRESRPKPRLLPRLKFATLARNPYKITISKKSLRRNHITNLALKAKGVLEELEEDQEIAQQNTNEQLENGGKDDEVETFSSTCK